MPEIKRDNFLRESASSEIKSKSINRSTFSSEQTKNGQATLPLELWRVVLSYLSTRDLCRCSQTCKDWNDLVLSLDSTRWRELFLQQKSAKRWKHPNWPNSTHIDPKSWQSTYKIHSLAAQQWLRTNVDASCTFYGGLLGIFRGPKQRKVIHVGRDRRYSTINRALSAARPFDTIVLEPNHYQQFPLALKFPIEIVGIGDPSKVVITMLIEHTASSARLANVMFKPSYPRQRGRGASSLLIKVLSGHLQLDNCLFEQGQIHVSTPGSVNVRYCTFNAAHICFKGAGLSNVSNCKFKPDRVAISVEDPSLPAKVRVFPAYIGGWVEMVHHQSVKDYYMKKIRQMSSKVKGNLENAVPIDSSESSLGSVDKASVDKSNSDVHNENESDLSLGKKGESGYFESTLDIPASNDCVDADTISALSSVRGVIFTNNKVEGGRGGVTVSRIGQAWIEGNVFTGLVYGIRCMQSSRAVILNNKISNCDTSAIFMREHSSGLVAGNHIFDNFEAGIDLRSNSNPVIQQNHIYSGKRSGIVCLDSSRGIIRNNEIYNNKEAGVYILYKGNPTVMYNRIWSGRAAGVAVTEDGKGHISYNDICSMEWAGIDIRNGADPVVSHNKIRKGQADGIVIGEGGKGILYDNDIQGNHGCGIWILDGAQPLIHTNRIMDCGDSGIAFVSNSDLDHDAQQLHAQFLQQEQHQDIAEIVESSDDEEFVPPINDFEEPESRFVLVSRPDKRLAQVECNKITNNRGHGILYSGSDGVVISRNTISYNMKHGMVLTRPAEISAQDNNITFNNLSGISVLLGVCCTIQGNGIYHNKEYGIQTAGVGIIKENDIFGHKMAAIYVKMQGDPHITRNRLQGVQQECVFVEDNTRGLIEQNELHHYSFVNPIYYHANSQVQIANNRYIVLIKHDNDGLETAIDLEYLNLNNPSPRPLMQMNPETRGPFFPNLSYEKKRSNMRRNVAISSLCSIL